MAAENHRTGKRLGQHFLKNETAIKKIIAALELRPRDTIIEIGPGHGELTEYLVHGAWFMDRQSRIIAIEKDGQFATELKKRFAGNENLEVIEGDALKVLPKLIRAYELTSLRAYKLVGNIPYYITGRLLRILSELEKKPELSVLTIQKEVAERITARPPRMNRLAASVQFWTKPETLAHISRGSFEPRPETDSSVIRFKINDLKPKIRGEDYYKAVRALFAQPRKTIVNNLVSTEKMKRHAVAEYLTRIGISPGDRPQNLSVEQIIKIAQFLASPGD